MTVRKIVGKVHLWLGLTSGLLVFIIAITGALYSFQNEIQDATQPYRFVQKQEREFVVPSVVRNAAVHALPGKQLHAIMYQGTIHAAEALFYSDDYFYIVYINQYTSEVLKVSDENAGFFRFILDGHYYLWLPHKVGHLVVASATLIFFAMVISGMILWWPRNKQGRKQRFSIKWNARWRRKNYDLHNVLGFYIAIMAIVFSITGLVWGFEWFSKVYYAAISGGKKMAAYEEPHSKPAVRDNTQLPAIDRIWFQIKDLVPEKGSIEIHEITDSSSSIAVNINPDPST